MSDFIPPGGERSERPEAGVETVVSTPRDLGRPSNDVYARVGDAVLHAAREGVRGGMRPEDIIRELVTEHHVRLSLGELRLLLASRRIPKRAEQEAPNGELVTL